MAANYKTGYASQKYGKKISVFTFPSDPDKQELWVNVLINILTTSVTKHIGICGLHCPEGHPTEVASGGTRRVSVPRSVFNVPSSFFRKSAPAKSRNVQDRKLDIESRAKKQRQSQLRKIKSKIGQF